MRSASPHTILIALPCALVAFRNPPFSEQAGDLPFRDVRSLPRKRGGFWNRGIQRIPARRRSRAKAEGVLIDLRLGRVAWPMRLIMTRRLLVVYAITGKSEMETVPT